MVFKATRLSKPYLTTKGIPIVISSVDLYYFPDRDSPKTYIHPDNYPKNWKPYTKGGYYSFKVSFKYRTRTNWESNFCSQWVSPGCINKLFVGLSSKYLLPDEVKKALALVDKLKLYTPEIKFSGNYTNFSLNLQGTETPKLLSLEYPETYPYFHCPDEIFKFLMTHQDEYREFFKVWDKQRVHFTYARVSRNVTLSNPNLTLVGRDAIVSLSRKFVKMGTFRGFITPGEEVHIIGCFNNSLNFFYPGGYELLNEFTSLNNIFYNLATMHLADKCIINKGDPLKRREMSHEKIILIPAHTRRHPSIPGVFVPVKAHPRRGGTIHAS